MFREEKSRRASTTEIGRRQYGSRAGRKQQMNVRLQLVIRMSQPFSSKRRDVVLKQAAKQEEVAANNRAVTGEGTSVLQERTRTRTNQPTIRMFLGHILRPLRQLEGGLEITAGTAPSIIYNHHRCHVIASPSDNLGASTHFVWGVLNYSNSTNEMHAMGQTIVSINLTTCSEALKLERMSSTYV